MVEGVLGGAAGDEPGRAPGAGKLFGRTGGADPDLRDNPGPDSLDGGDVMWREGPLPEPEHARVENLGVPDMGHDLVAIPATAARALAQHERCDGRGLLKQVPCHLGQLYQPFSLLRRHGFAVQSRRDVERAEVGRCGPGDPLQDLESSRNPTGSNGTPALAHTCAYRGAAAASAARAASSPRPGRHHPGHWRAHAKTLRLPASR